LYKTWKFREVQQVQQWNYWIWIHCKRRQFVFWVCGFIKTNEPVEVLEKSLRSSLRIQCTHWVLALAS